MSSINPVATMRTRTVDSLTVVLLPAETAARARDGPAPRRSPSSTHVVAEVAATADAAAGGQQVERAGNRLVAPSPTEVPGRGERDPRRQTLPWLCGASR